MLAFRISFPSRLFVAMALVVASSRAQAQDGVPPGGKQVLSLNPIAVVFGVYGVEYERALSATSSATLGASATYLPIGDFYYTSIEAKARYYFDNKAIVGFYGGITAGFTRVGADVDDLCTGFAASSDCGNESASAIGAGVEIGYQWLTGKEKKYTVALAGGAKKLFFLGSDLDGAQAALPTIRFNFGYRF